MGESNRLGDFEVIRTLGVGSFGKVKRRSFFAFENPGNLADTPVQTVARHQQTGHRVAMKFIGKKKISTEESASFSTVPSDLANSSDSQDG